MKRIKQEIFLFIIFSLLLSGCKRKPSSVFYYDPKDLNIVYWFEKRGNDWNLITYIENSSFFKFYPISIIKSIYFKNYSKKRITESVDITLPPKEKIYYITHYNDSIYVVILPRVTGSVLYALFWLPNISWDYLLIRKKANFILFQEPLMFFNSVIPPRAIPGFGGVCLITKSFSTLKSTNKIWNVFSFEPMFKISEGLPEGKYWVSSGVFVRLDYPDIPIVREGDSFKLTFYFKIPDILYKEYKKDTLFILGRFIREYRNMVKNKEYIYKYSPNFDIIFSKDVIVRDEENVVYFLMDIPKGSFRKLGYKGIIKKEDFDKYLELTLDFPSYDRRYLFASVSSNLDVRIIPFKLKLLEDKKISDYFDLEKGSAGAKYPAIFPLDCVIMLGILKNRRKIYLIFTLGVIFLIFIMFTFLKFLQKRRLTHEV